MALQYWGQTPFQEETQIPKSLVVSFGIQKICCGEEHFLLLSTNGTLYGLGGNQNGCLAQDDLEFVTKTPTVIFQDVITVESGWAHSVLVTSKRQAFIWGNSITAPKLIANNIAQVSCGARHSLLVSTSGELLAIGANDQGQCGVESKKLTDVTFVMDNVQLISCGVSHSLIKSEGSLLVCGSNSLQQLGLPGVKNSFKVLRLELPGEVQQIAAGNHSACICDDQLYVWGTGSFGTFNKPFKFMDEISTVRIAGACGFAIDKSQNLFAWGTNVNGELGLGDSQPRSQPTKVMKNVSMIAPGMGYCLAVIKNTPLLSEKEYLAKTLEIQSEERSALERINREIKGKLHENEYQVIELQDILQQKNEEIQALKNMTETITNEFKVSQSQVKDLKQQCLRYQTVHREAIQTNEAYEMHIKEVEDLLLQKKQQCEELSEQVESYKVNLDHFQKDENMQLSEFKEQLTEISDQLMYEQQMNSQLTQQIQSERETVAQKNRIITKLEYESSNLASQNKQLLTQASAQLTQHQKLSEALTMANHRIESLQTNNAKLMQELSTIKTNLYADTNSNILDIHQTQTLNKQLTELNNQLQQQLRQRDQELLRLKTQSMNESHISSSKSVLQQSQTSRHENQASPMGKTIGELLESAHKHAKMMKKILKDHDSPSPKKKLNFSKENSLVKQDKSTTKLIPARQLIVEHKLRS